MDFNLAGLVTKLIFASAVLCVISLWMLFVKAGKPGYYSLIPFYNLYILYQTVGWNGWTFLFLFFPLLNLLVFFQLTQQIVTVYGNRNLFLRVAIFFFPYLTFPILALPMFKYQRPANL